MSEVLLRFAPSPTGYLHAGNARVAVLNFLFARQQGGAFWLRLDDTDKTRSKRAYEEAIEEDLGWLLAGLGGGWDKKIRQSERLALYETALEKLRALGRLYPCFETAEELALARRMRLRSHRPPVYDRASLEPERRRAYEREGRKPHWRFKLEHRPLVIRDLFRGESRFDFARTSDPVLTREDGQPLFTLTSVVDDGECGVSHIVRGEDHATNSAVQSQLCSKLWATSCRAWRMFLCCVAARASILLCQNVATACRCAPCARGGSRRRRCCCIWRSWAAPKQREETRIGKRWFEDFLSTIMVVLLRCLTRGICAM